MGSNVTVLLFTSQASPQSGASRAVLLYADTLRRMGLCVHLAAPTQLDFGHIPPDVSFWPIPFARLRRTLNPVPHLLYLSRALPDSYRLMQIMRDERVDVIHVNEIIDLLGGLAARLAGVPVVWHVRAGLAPGPVRQLLVRCLNYLALAVVVPSEAVASYLIQDCPSIEAKIEVVREMLFNINEYDPSKPAQPIRRELNIPTVTPIVLLVSKLQTGKGHLVFAEAAHVVARHPLQPVFIVVGDAVDGHEREAELIRATLKQRVPPQQLRLLGYRDDLSSLYAAADIYVHCPTFPDPFPTVVMLGMAMAKASIGSAIGGIPEQIIDGETGILVPPGNVQALADAITSLVNDPDRRLALGQAARKTCLEQYAAMHQLGSLPGIYQRVIGIHGGAGF